MKQAIKLAVGKLELQPGDILVVKLLRKNVPETDMRRIQDEMTRFVGSACRVMVMDNEMQLTVVKAAEAPARDTEHHPV